MFTKSTCCYCEASAGVPKQASHSSCQGRLDNWGSLPQASQQGGLTGPQT